MLTEGRVSDAITDPLMGHLSDRTRTRPGARRRGDPVPETLRVSYGPPQNRKKQWPDEAQMEGWFSRSREEQRRYENAQHKD